MLELSVVGFFWSESLFWPLNSHPGRETAQVQEWMGLAPRAAWILSVLHKLAWGGPVHVYMILGSRTQKKQWQQSRLSLEVSDILLLPSFSLVRAAGRPWRGSDTDR